MGDASDTGVKGRLERVGQQISEAARAVGRDPQAVHLIAVSKTFEAEEIRPVIEAGQRRFGENRVQEAKAKWPGLMSRWPDIELHLIGPLQSNKTREAMELFHVIHTVDRPKIARAIAEEIARTGKQLKLFVQVNTGEEPQKAGIGPKDVAGFVTLCRDELKLSIVGLMCIPPADEAPAVHFAFMAKLARELGLPELSMGMSADFSTAIEFGATHVRVGSAIFGHRA